MAEVLATLFASDGFAPHGYCLLWNRPLLWLFVASDSLIALSYYSIPVALIYFVRKRRDLAFNWIFLMFAAFILACGTTHVMGLWTIWHGVYWLDGAVKGVTAVASVATAVTLWPLLPQALALPSPSQLQAANTELQRQVTERRRAEETLARQAQDLARSNAELEQFAYAAAHDLQEPLRMVASFTQLLAKRYKGRLDADADEFVAYAVDGATRMQGMIQGLLDYSRLGAREGEFAPADCELILAQTRAALMMTIDELGATLTHDPLPTVVADASRLGQVFQNLIGNALRFRGVEPPRVHVRAERGTGEWRFTVRDNGIGIAPPDFDRIFQVFRRLHGRAEYPGTGIGLAICKKVVEGHGGRIWVESEPGQGTTFSFTIPDSGAHA